VFNNNKMRKNLTAEQVNIYDGLREEFDLFSGT